MKNFARSLTACAAMVLASVSATAQDFPTKPITLIVPFAPGASADAVARVVGKEVSTALGQPVIVDNKPGGGGALGLIAVARSPADGYTIGLGATGAIAINPRLADAPPLDPQKDLTPIAKVADIPLILVAGSGSGINSVKDLVQKSKSSPDGLSFGTAGQYTSHHLAGELFASVTGAHLIAVPYRGSGPAVTEALGGTIPLVMADMTSAYPHIKAGKLIGLGVTTATRSKIAPEIPTIAEGGVPGYSAAAWMGFFAPAKCPPAVLAKLAKAVETALSNPHVQAQLLSVSAEPAYMPGPAFAQFINDESSKWASVIAKVSAPVKQEK